MKAMSKLALSALLFASTLAITALPASANTSSEPYGYCQVTHLSPIASVNQQTPLARLVILANQVRSSQQLLAVEDSQAPSEAIAQVFFDASSTLAAAKVDLSWATLYTSEASSSHSATLLKKASSMLVKFDSHVPSSNRLLARINALWAPSCHQVRRDLSSAIALARAAVSAPPSVAPSAVSPSFYETYVTSNQASLPSPPVLSVSTDPANSNSALFQFASGYQVCLSAYTLSPQELAC